MLGLKIGGGCLWCDRYKYTNLLELFAGVEKKQKQKTKKDCGNCL
jgi:hypothetical protein